MRCPGYSWKLKAQISTGTGMNYLNLVEHVKVLILDDQAISRSIIAQVIKHLSPTATIHEADTPASALAWAKEFTADLIIVDFEMPGMNGIDFVREVRRHPDYHAVPTLMITIKKDVETRYAALDAGVTDFLTKPVDMHECAARCRNLITMRQQQLLLEDKSRLLEARVRKATADILAREKETLMRLARAGEYRDSDTGKHLLRMSLYSRLLAKAIGMTDDESELIELAAPLHDIGKIGIPDSILRKNGPLTEDELQIIRQHPVIGFEILEGSPSKHLQKGSEIALAHHEKFNGSGYPYGLTGESIPLSARIVAIADVFDALTSTRPYKKAWEVERSMQYLVNESNQHFDPDLVKAMVSIRKSLEEIHRQHAI